MWFFSQVLQSGLSPLWSEVRLPAQCAWVLECQLCRGQHVAYPWDVKIASIEPRNGEHALRRSSSFGKWCMTLYLGYFSKSATWCQLAFQSISGGGSTIDPHNFRTETWKSGQMTLVNCPVSVGKTRSGSNHGIEIFYSTHLPPTCKPIAFDQHWATKMWVSVHDRLQLKFEVVAHHWWGQRFCVRSGPNHTLLANHQLIDELSQFVAWAI